MSKIKGITIGALALFLSYSTHSNASIPELAPIIKKQTLEQKIGKDGIDFDINGDGINDSRYFLEEGKYEMVHIDSNGDNKADMYGVVYQKDDKKIVINFVKHGTSFVYSPNFIPISAESKSKKIRYDFQQNNIVFLEGHPKDEESIQEAKDLANMIYNLAIELVKPLDNQ